MFTSHSLRKLIRNAGCLRASNETYQDINHMTIDLIRSTIESAVKKSRGTRLLRQHLPVFNSRTDGCKNVRDCLLLSPTAFARVSNAILLENGVTATEPFLKNMQYYVEKQMTKKLYVACQATQGIGKRKTLMKRDIDYVNAYGCNVEAIPRYQVIRAPVSVQLERQSSRRSPSLSPMRYSLATPSSIRLPSPRISSPRAPSPIRGSPPRMGSPKRTSTVVRRMIKGVGGRKGYFRYYRDGRQISKDEYARLKKLH